MRGGTFSTLRQLLVNLAGEEGASRADPSRLDTYNYTSTNETGSPENLDSIFYDLSMCARFDANNVRTLFRNAVAQIAFRAIDAAGITTFENFGLNVVVPEDIVVDIAQRVINRYARRFWGDGDQSSFMTLLEICVTMLARTPVTQESIMQSPYPVDMLDNLLEFEE